MAGEARVEAYLKGLVKELGGEAIKIGHGGWPDELVLFPGGQPGFAELKDFGEKPRALQVARMETLAALGFKVAAPDSREAVRRFVAELRAC